MEDNNVLCQEGDCEANNVIYPDSQDYRVEERNTEATRGEDGRKDSNENEVETETKDQEEQLPIDQFGPSVDSKTITEKDDREEGEIVEETKDSNSNEDEEAKENETAEAEAEAVIQSIEKDRKQVVISEVSEENKTEPKKITGILVLPDNIFYNLLESSDDELGLYFTDSDIEDEPETETADPQNKEGLTPTIISTSDTVDQQSNAVSEEALRVERVVGGENSQEKQK